MIVHLITRTEQTSEIRVKIQVSSYVAAVEDSRRHCSLTQRVCMLTVFCKCSLLYSGSNDFIYYTVM